MKKLLIKFMTMTSEWSWPLSQKKFIMSDYLALEDYFEEEGCQFAVALVSTSGAVSNFWIRLSFLFGNQKHKFSNLTHAAVYIGEYHYPHTVVESIGKGVLTRTLVELLCNRDNVKILIPSKKMNRKVVQNIRENAIKISKRDEISPIGYDYSHNPNDQATYDCSELIYDSVKKAYLQADQPCPLKTIRRLGQETYSPIDLEFSDLFETVYDSKKGFLNGKI